MAPVKCKRDIVCVLTMLKNSENDGTEEIGIVAPTPARPRGYHWFGCFNISNGFVAYMYLRIWKRASDQRRSDIDLTCANWAFTQSLLTLNSS